MREAMFYYGIPLLLVGVSAAAAVVRSEEIGLSRISAHRWQTILKLWAGYLPSLVVTYLLVVGYFWLATWLGLHEPTGRMLQSSGGSLHNQPPLGSFITPFALLGLAGLAWALCCAVEEFWKGNIKKR